MKRYMRLESPGRGFVGEKAVPQQSPQTAVYSHLYIYTDNPSGDSSQNKEHSVVVRKFPDIESLCIILKSMLVSPEDTRAA